MSESKDVQLKISGESINLECSISENLAKRVILLVVTGDDLLNKSLNSVLPLQSNDMPNLDNPNLDSSSLSLREFINRHNPKRNPEMIATMADYLRQYRNMHDVTRNDLIKAYESCKESVPKNLSRDINWTCKVGWLAERHGKKDNYYLTDSGEKAVKAHFPEEIRKKTKVSSGGRRKKVAKEN